VSARPRAWVATFSVVLAAVSAIAVRSLLMAATQVSTATLLDPIMAPQAEKAKAEIQLACTLAVVGFLAIIPIALYLRRRFRDSEVVRQASFAAFLTVYIGVPGAILLAMEGAPLLLEVPGQYPKGPDPGGEFQTIYGAVVDGDWKTIEPVLAALWLIPVGLVARRDGARLLGLGLAAVGLILLLVPLSRFT
jgi:hypothetical protein